MSFLLKAATIAALAASTLSGLMASDATLAAGTAASHSNIPVTIPASAVEAPASQDPSVIFAAPREVVQPLSPSSTSTAAAGSESPAPSLLALVEEHGAPEQLDEEMRCLAGAVYYESKGESLDGQLAVARVIINRAQSGRFASSLCGVVKQRGQFSFVRGNVIPEAPVASRDWREAVAIAQIAVEDSWDSRAEGALFFHARRVSPGWGKAKLASIDNHIFYR